MLTADRSSYFVRLGDLAPGFRQRAFEHALSHLQHGQFQARAALAQLEESFEQVRALPSPRPLLQNSSPGSPSHARRLRGFAGPCGRGSGRTADTRHSRWGAGAVLGRMHMVRDPQL